MRTTSGEPRTAAEWMARLRAAASGREDRRAYERWLRASPENRAAAAAVVHVWRWIGVLERDPLVQRVLERHRGPLGR